MINFVRLSDIARALKPNHDSYHFHCSFILKGQRILSIGLNNERKTNPNNIKYKYVGRFGEDISSFVGTHSEYRAIRKLNQLDLSRCKLINIRIDNNNNITNSRPCIGCQNLIRVTSLREVWFSDEVGNFKEFV